MAYFELPIVENFYNYKYSAALDSITYLVGLRYNERMDTWFISLYNRNDEALIEGIPLKLGVDLFGKYSHISGMPLGMFRCINWEDNEEPNSVNLGVKCVIVYFGVN